MVETSEGPRLKLIRITQVGLGDGAEGMALLSPVETDTIPSMLPELPED
jgi:hypothetical protein